MLEKIIFRKMGLPLLGSLFCLMISITAYAKDARAEIPDLTRTGSISVEMKSDDTGEAVPGGSITLYLTAYYIWEGSGYIFRHTEDFIDFSDDEYYFTINDLSAEKAEEHAAYVDEMGIKGVTKDIGDNGKVKFSNLEAGLYLLVQKEAPEDFYCVNPFFVTVPLLDEFTKLYEYNVDATPKTRPYEGPMKQEWTPLEPAYMHPAELAPAYTHPAELTPAYTHPAELIPAYTHPAELTPAYTNPAELTPAYTNPAELSPAYTHPAELEPAYTHPVELGPAYTYPVILEPAYTKPAALEPAYINLTEIDPAHLATPSDAMPEEPDQPAKINSHHGSNGGGGSREVNKIQENEMPEIEDERWELAPLAQTGERQNIFFGGMLFILSGILLLIIVWMRLKEGKKFG